MFLSRGENGGIKEISRQEAVDKLLPVVSIPWFHGEAVHELLRFCDNLIASVPVYELTFKPAPEVAERITAFARDKVR